MAATLMLACSNDKSGGHDGDEGVETEVTGTQLDGNTTLYGLVTDTSGNPIPGVVVSDGYGCVTTDANGVYQMERYKKARFVHYSTPAGYASTRRQTTTRSSTPRSSIRTSPTATTSC